MSETSMISASILSADFADLSREIEAAESAGVNWIHIDVMDGHFVPNLTMGPFIIRTVRAITNLPLDVHLMIENPERSLSDYAKAGADHITVHIEACPHIHRTLQQIKQLGCKAGIAINPGTSLTTIEEVVTSADIVLIMTVNPGYSGQEFIRSSSQKIARCASMLEHAGSSALIEVDGGISAATIPIVYQAGARAFVAASAIFNHSGGITAGVRDLQTALRQTAVL